ncbi:MAG: DUF4912 domain-containing protein, partial [Treponema sp.]|nr:DUF4912 domain-containing protein [Treponema sp.]
MDEIPFTRAHLESLSTDELIKIADNYGVDIPFGLDRIFIIEELLEIIADDDDQGENPQEKDLVDGGLIESVPLPKQYNITFIEVMVRDPLWIFVFWEVKSQDKEVFEKSPEFDGYCLKVFRAEKVKKENEADVIFRVPVKPSDSAWYIGFTPSD